MFRHRGIECNVNAEVDWVSFAANLVFSLRARVCLLRRNSGYCRTRNLHKLIILSSSDLVTKESAEKKTCFRKLLRIISITDSTSAAQFQFALPHMSDISVTRSSIRNGSGTGEGEQVVGLKVVGCRPTGMLCGTRDGTARSGYLVQAGRGPSAGIFV